MNTLNDFSDLLCAYTDSFTDVDMDVAKFHAHRGGLPPAKRQRTDEVLFAPVLVGFVC